MIYADYPIEKMLDDGQVSVFRMSRLLGGDLRGVRDILTGRVPMNRDVAHVLMRSTGVSEKYWMRMEHGHGLSQVQAAIESLSVRPVYTDAEFIPSVYGTKGLISIALVDDEGHEFYAVNSDVDWKSVVSSEWLLCNVVPHLPLNPDGSLDTSDLFVMPLLEIRKRLVRFFAASKREAELYAFWGSQDMTRILEMWDNDWSAIPSVVPKWVADLQYLNRLKGCPSLPQHRGKVHHALHDARYDRELHQFLLSMPWAV